MNEVIRQSVITITDLPRPDKGRAETSTRMQVSATHNPFIGGEQVPAKWLTKDRVTAILRAIGYAFVDVKTEWHQTYLRSCEQQPDGSWIVWIYQEWLD